ncbi:DUF5979 domain-containing protein [Glycomyces sp. NPDC048151]|uniref:DUF5979 domain-containing protein n=1 Tax=Glycomyces sp. NPDC048151 TaxID=3364002 RepID=UPI0037168CFD
MQAVLVPLLALGLVLVPSLPAMAQEQAFFLITKEASVATVQPGGTFTYTIQVSCTGTDGCVDAVLTDPVPDEFLIEGTPQVSGVDADAAVDGQNVTVTFTEALSVPAGAVGMPGGSTAEIQIQVRADPDLPYSANGVPVTNTATVDADNADPKPASADVTPEVPLDLAASAAKSIDPAQAVAEPGTTATATLTGTNDANAEVDYLRITDPTDPSASGNPFEYLAFTGFGAVTFPEGADQVQVDAWTGSAWVDGTPAATAALPTGVSADAVMGLRFTFTASSGDPLPIGASASVELQLEQRDNVVDLTAQTTLTNTVQSEVAADGETATGDASDTYVLTPQQITAGAAKSFDPDQVPAGEPSTVTLTGTNAGTPVDTMTVTEPDPAAASNPFTSGLTFTGFTDGVVWPATATSAEITYTYDDGTTETLSTTTADTLPAPTGTVTGFSVVFTGDIEAGAVATIPFTVDTDPDQVEEEVLHDNQVLVEVARGGRTATDTATASLTTIAARLAVDVDKSMTPDEILSVAGETTVVELPAQIEPFPASSTDATHFIVQDPPTVPPNPSPDEFWNSFDAIAITQTAIPAGATLTIYYWDGSQWLVLPGAQDLAGPDVVNIPIDASIRDDVQGLRFDYYDPDGFPPGTSVQPNFTAELRDQKRDGSGAAAGGADEISDCAGATASTDEVSGTAVVPDPCPIVTLTPVTPGEGDLMSKNFVEPTPGAGTTVVARSQQQIDAQLHWSTGGYSGLDEVVVSDVADPETTAVADSFFNAFDLVAIPAISAAQDPWLTYDAVSTVELWNGSAWVQAANDPCPGACDGTFPGLTLTDAEQESTTGVRLVFVESPTRADRIGTDPTLPQVGSGVSRSSGDDRLVTLTFAVRDEVRDPQSTPDPALGSREYNVAGSPGDVLDTARATGYQDGTQVATDADSDDVTIIDVPLNTEVTKEWTGGPLGLPPAGTDPDDYPSGRITIEGTNNTAAKVDELRIADPLTTDPMDVFDITDIVTATPASGTETAAVVLTYEDGSAIEWTVDEALALTEAQLASVVGVTFRNTGRIDAGATATLVFDTRLRAEHRSSGDAVTLADSPITNDTQVTVADLGGTADDAPTDTDDAQIELAPLDISVTAGKSFSPNEITEPSNGPVTMQLTGQPDGDTRTEYMTVTDDEPKLWNQYDFAGFGDFSFAAPIDRVQVDAFTGATYTAGADGVTVTGGSWTEGTPGTAPALPDGVAAADVQGLRFMFTRDDGDIWENPHNPLQAVNVQLTRRDEMRTGGPVPSDLAANDPAPGETEPGVASNTVEVTATSATSGGQSISDTDTADAQVRYKHAVNGVSVVKLADGAANGGVKPPGQALPYTLQVTNTGDRAIVDPVVRDVLPTDADGAQLMFDPEDNPGGDGAFSYALTGSAPDPANGTAMPTDPADVTTDITGDVEQIVFTFPEGTVLEVGQVYTITVQLMIRPGLAGDTLVANTFGVTGDRAWDECDGTLDAATGECQASASVTVSTTASLRGVKMVRAVDDELGELSVSDDVPAEDCVENDQGFHVQPCVPITKPGGDHIWRANIANTGNVAMTKVIGVDQLPAVGDTGGINPTPRGSQWRPLFEGTTEIVSGAPAGTDILYEWTDDPDPCVSVDGCPDGSWTPSPQDGGPAYTEEILKSVTGLRYEITFPEDDLFEPLDVLTWELTTTTPHYSETAGADTIAWNTEAHAAVTDESGRVTEATVLPSEGSKVGVALATGHLAIEKTVTGDGAAYAPDEFTLNLQCTSAVGTWVEGEVPLGDKATQTVTPGETTVVTDLPYDAECTVTEDDAGGATSFTATTVNVVRETEDPLVIQAENVFDAAGLVVEKTVTTDAKDADGNPITYGPFTIDVACTFLGEAVYGTGYSAANPMTAALDDGEQAEFTGLPAGAECTVTETDTMDAASTTVTTVSGTDTPVVVDGATAPITLSPDDNGATANTATVTNAYEAGQVLLEKRVFGPGQDPIDEGPFIIDVTCTLDDASGSRVVWEGEFSLGGGQPLEARIDDVAAGATCEATETNDGGASLSVVLPRSVAVDSGRPVTIYAVNAFGAGSLQVVKEVTGDGAELYGAGPFEVALDCTFDTGVGVVGVDIPGGPTREYSVDEPAVYDGLPIGSECVLTETATGGATETVISGGTGDGDTVRIPRTQADLTVTNRFDLGGLAVEKYVSGADAAEYADRTFTVKLVCTRDVNGDRVAVDVPGGASREIEGGETVTYTGLPAGAACSLSETDDGGAHDTAIEVNGEDTADFEVTACDAAACDEAEVYNYWSADALSVTGLDLRTALMGALLLLAAGILMIVSGRIGAQR